MTGLIQFRRRCGARCVLDCEKAIILSVAPCALQFRKKASTAYVTHIWPFPFLSSQLEAEEDICRHNKLVGFYERLGCSVKTQAKIQYINNNDGETYRKVPMQIVLEPVASRACPDAGSKQGGKAVAEQKWACQSYSSTVAVMHGGDGRQCHVHKRHRIGLSPSLVDLPVEFGFLPVRLLSSVNTLAIASSSGDEDSAPSPNSWILAEDGRGFVQFRTTGGGRLVVTCDGGVRVLGGEEDYVECDAVRGSGILDSTQCDDNMCYFSLRRVPDGHDYVPDSDESEMDAAAAAPPQSSPRCSKDLWVLQNARGRFLTTDPLTHQLICTSAPSFWQADRKHRNLVCTTDTPPRRIHYRNAWLRQTVMRVGEMRARFLRFRLRRMTMRKALHDIAASLPLDPFLVNGAGIDAAKNYRSPCLRTFSYFFAEMLRKSGYPDWMQLTALIHEIGRVVYFLDTESAAEAEKEGYDWTVSCRSRVVGCRAPARASFDEFRSLCPDETDDRYRSALGMYEEGCGLANVWLAWTGPEYVYHMLRHNGAVLPEEGMAILRLFPLGDWHCYGECGHLANEDDEDLREWVAEFDELRRRARRECTSIQREDLSDADCRRLWETSYAPIAAKYGCDHTFSW